MLTAEFLYKAMQQKKIAHAYLLSGNNEIAKQKLVADFFDLGIVHTADKIHVEPTQEEISIGSIRGLSVFLSMSSWNSPYKVVIIEKADAMNTQAQSAFLKLLEEPKGDTLFFLLTLHADALLDTIRSRVQEFKFYSYRAVVSTTSAAELETLTKSNIASRFVAAKNLADNPAEIPQKLIEWLAVLRQDMIKNLKNNPKDAVKRSETIQTLQEVLYALQTSNVNPRLALERLMLDL